MNSLPLWARSLNEMGDSLGGPQSIIDLSAASLLRASGAESVPKHLGLLLDCLTQEAHLSTVGAIMARSELVRALRFRRVLEKEHYPKLDNTRASSSNLVFIIGFARSGTSLLQRALAQQVDINSPTTYEVLMPNLNDKSSVSEHIASATLQDELWNLLDPEFPAIHRNSGELPAECLPVQSASMLSHHWTGCYSVPTYEKHLDAETGNEPFREHLSFCERLLRRRPSSLLLLKSPAYARQIRSLISIYPDAKFILLIRSLKDAVESHARLLKSIRFMRSTDASVLDASSLDAVRYFDTSIRSIKAELDQEDLNRDNLYAVSYDSLVSAPRKTVRNILSWLLDQRSAFFERDSAEEEKISYDRLEATGSRTAPSVEIQSAVVESFEDLCRNLTEKGCLHA